MFFKESFEILSKLIFFIKETFFNVKNIFLKKVLKLFWFNKKLLNSMCTFTDEREGGKEAKSLKVKVYLKRP